MILLWLRHLAFFKRYISQSEPLFCRCERYRTYQSIKLKMWEYTYTINWRISYWIVLIKLLINMLYLHLHKFTESTKVIVRQWVVILYNMSWNIHFNQNSMIFRVVENDDACMVLSDWPHSFLKHFFSFFIIVYVKVCMLAVQNFGWFISLKKK